MAIALVICVQIIVILMSGCQNSTLYTWGEELDITEDLYHRIKAGLFEVGEEPVVCHIVRYPNLYTRLRLPFYSESAPHTMVRVSWERGSFLVKSDDQALVVIYMDSEVIFSHVHIATPEGFSNDREFRGKGEHPIL